MSPPPSLLHLTLVTTVLHIHRLSDLSSVPDHLVFILFQKTLAAGKLTDYVLRMFLATGNDEVLQLVKALGVRRVIKPILPTQMAEVEGLGDLLLHDARTRNFSAEALTSWWYCKLASFLIRIFLKPPTDILSTVRGGRMWQASVDSDMARMRKKG